MESVEIKYHRIQIGQLQIRIKVLWDLQPHLPNGPIGAYLPAAGKSLIPLFGKPRPPSCAPAMPPNSRPGVKSRVSSS